MNYSWAFQQERGQWSEVYSKLINGGSVLRQAATLKNWQRKYNMEARWTTEKSF